MKKNVFILITIILSLLFVSTSLFAQINEAKAKATVENFFTLCKKSDFKNASNLLAYNGKDKSRIYKDFFNPNNPDEFKEVKRVCKKVTATLLISDSYSFGKFRDRTIDKKKFKSLDVIFLSGKQKVKQKVLLIDVNGKTAIYDFN
ncbi:MAG: hypothetical protein KAI45_04490 [Melioribacteraceae bacterium]|nr:hypothetical protein [Melioribacteraceae bacterium]